MRVRASAPDFWRAQSFDTWNGRVWTALAHPRRRASAAASRSTSRGRRDDGPPFGIVADRRARADVLRRATGPEHDLRRRRRRRSSTSPTAPCSSSPTASLRAGVAARRGQRLHRRQPAPARDRRRRCARVRSDAGARASSAQLYARAARSRPTGCARSPTRSPRARRPTYDKVRALEAWMGANTKYTLDIPPLPTGRDAVDQFLFVDQQGFCEQIGTSLVVMLRSLGIPARLAVGYATGRAQPVHRALRGPGEGRPRLGRGVLPRRRLAGLRPDRAGAARRRLDHRRRRHRRARLPQRPDRRSRPGPRSRSACSALAIGLGVPRRLVVAPSRPSRRAGSSRAGPRPGSTQLERLGARRGRPERPARRRPSTRTRSRASIRSPRTSCSTIAAHHRRGDVLAGRRRVDRTATAVDAIARRPRASGGVSPPARASAVARRS